MGAISAIKRVPVFISEVKQELKKVSWSTRQELLGATWVVITITLILALYIGSLDIALSKFLTLVLK